MSLTPLICHHLAQLSKLFCSERPTLPIDPKITNSMDSENTRLVLECVESFLLKFTSQTPTLLDALCVAATILKQTNTTFHPISFQSSTGTHDLLSTIAIELRHAAEAADSKQFFIYSQKIKTSSCILQMLMEEAKQARRKIDSLALRNTTSLERLQLQNFHIYIEQAFNILYILNLELHEIQLTANGLYVHGLKEDKPLLQEMDGLKDAIARFVSIVSSKHFKSSFTTPLRQ
ncbi:uncharacterized protein LOC128719950 [Anopheles marshallii]|uniref:uncharacterized protein LOC128719950 n=1 Tax=Anopheles marshallii TaxID=1521116 RepID=UPI00237BA8C0|nr:uncharacterized protein LOC128719950 [Anopheles marshallii]